MTIPVELRQSYEETSDHPTVKALNRFVKKFGLAGAVLISFDAESERVSVNSSATTAYFGRVMDELATRILQRIDDGEFEPTEVH